MSDPTSDDDSLPPELGRLLHQAVSAVSEARERALSARGMTEREWLALRTMAEAGPIGLPQLMARFHHFTFFPQSPEILDHLGERGWLEERTEGPGHLSVFALTPAGLAQTADTAAALEAIGQQAVVGVPRPAQDAVIRFLEGVVARLRNPGSS